MAKTASTQLLSLGSQAPDFKLLDVVSKQIFSLHMLRGELATVIMFICNHCKYVNHIQKKLVEVANKYQTNAIHFIAINSNDVENYPDDNPEKMREQFYAQEFIFPYFFDETQETAKAYHAACTPDFFIFDKDLKCVYRGRFDDATPGNDNPVTGKDLTDALDAISEGKPISEIQHPSLGCGIKWKSD